MQVPDLAALERAGASFQHAPNKETERRSAALQAFSGWAELLALYGAGVSGKPTLN
jgi:hypothetical protein